jgi:1,5-anhydro-D-fructose reductase (1,5-anhydro-D-mannitol-forming)
MVVRWGIIGLGDIAERNFVPAVAAAADTELVSVVSRSMSKAQAFAAKHRVTRAYDSLDSMLADPDLDAVYIATPNALHAEQTIAAARAGKHVLCDKPMALTEEEGERMIEESEKHGVKLAVAFRNRYHPAHVDTRRHVKAGDLGEIQYAKAQLFVGGKRGHWQGWRSDPAMGGSGSIVGQAVHPVDLLRFVLDSEVVELRCVTDEAPPARPVDESTYTLLTFRNGAHATVASGALVPNSDNDVVVYGSKAKIFCKGTLGTPKPGKPQEIIIEGNAGAIQVSCPPDDTAITRTARLIEDFNRSILEDTQPETISARNGLQMVKIASAMLDSSRSGKAVRFE